MEERAAALEVRLGIARLVRDVPVPQGEDLVPALLPAEEAVRIAVRLEVPGSSSATRWKSRSASSNWRSSTGPSPPEEDFRVVAPSRRRAS
jgi:hypothetical protein